MPDSLSADRTAEMLLGYFEAPERYRAEARRRDAPLLDSQVVLKLALGRRVELAHPVPAATLEKAAALYVRHLFFRPDATPYQTLGLAPGASPQAVKESFRLLMQLVHPDRQDARAVWPDSFAAQANRAYGILRDQDSRAQFDREAVARAAMARAMHRAASASAASKMPVVLPLRARFGRASAFHRVRLPEWLTAGVGGYAREHPAVAVFAVLIVAATLTVGAIAMEDKDGPLTWETPGTRGRATNASVAAAASASARSAAPSGARESFPSPTRAGSGAPSERIQPDASSSRADTAAEVHESAESRVELRLEPADAATARAPSPKAAPTLAPAPVAGVEASIASAPGTAPEGRSTVAPTAPPATPPSASAAVIAKFDQKSRVGSSAPEVASPVPATPAADPPPAAIANAPILVAVPEVRAESVAKATAYTVSTLPPANGEIEALFAAFVENYERGRLDAFTALFDDDADSNVGRGRAAIRNEYGELFRLSQWRRMRLTRINWKRAGDRAVANGEITVRIGWRDGREVEQQLAVDMEFVRRDGRALIAKMSNQERH